MSRVALALLLLILLATPAAAHRHHYCGQGTHKTTPVTRERYVGATYASDFKEHTYQPQYWHPTFGWTDRGRKFTRQCPR